MRWGISLAYLGFKVSVCLARTAPNGRCATKIHQFDDRSAKILPSLPYKPSVLTRERSIALPESRTIRRKEDKRVAEDLR